MAKNRKVTAGEKAAKVSGIYSIKSQIIGSVFLLLSSLLIWFLNAKNSGNNDAGVQSIRDQKVDTGSIQNYNVGGDMKIENNVYNGITKTTDSSNKNDKSILKKPAPISNQYKDAKINVTSNNQSGGQTANQIINNH